jgi:hypothetical protein
MLNQRKAGLPFILVTVFLDTLGFGFVIPILPALVATMTPDKQSQAHWYGLVLGSYGLAQFFSAPLLGAISDRYGRRTVLLVSIFGIGLTFFITAVSPWLWLLLVSRLDWRGVWRKFYRGRSLRRGCDVKRRKEPELRPSRRSLWARLYMRANSRGNAQRLRVAASVLCCSRFRAFELDLRFLCIAGVSPG